MESVPDESSLPESDVTVCGAESWLTHVTAAPTFTVTAEGLNEKSLMRTVVGEEANVVAGASVVVGDRLVSGALAVFGAFNVLVSSIVFAVVEGIARTVVCSTPGTVVVSVVLETQPDNRITPAIKTKNVPLMAPNLMGAVKYAVVVGVECMS